MTVVRSFLLLKRCITQPPFYIIYLKSSTEVFILRFPPLFTRAVDALGAPAGFHLVGSDPVYLAAARAATEIIRFFVLVAAVVTKYFPFAEALSFNQFSFHVDLLFSFCDNFSKMCTFLKAGVIKYIYVI